MSKPEVIIDLSVVTQKPKRSYENKKIIYIPTADIMITSSCNLDCDYCFESEKPAGNLTMDTFKHYIDNKGFIGFNLFGGEPFVNVAFMEDMLNYINDDPDIEPFLKTRLMNGAKNMITNGTLIHKQRNIDVIKKFDLRLQISVDGGKEAHDLKRVFKNDKTKGSFDIIQKNIEEICKKHDIKFSIHGVVCQDQLKYFLDSFKFSIDADIKNHGKNQALRQLNQNWTQIVFEDNYNDNDIDVLLDMMFGATEYLWNHSDLTMEEKKLGIGNLLTKKGGKCGAGYAYLAIDPNMDVYACHRMTDNEFTKKETQKMANIYEPENIKNKKLYNSFFNIGHAYTFLYGYKYFNYKYQNNDYLHHWINWCPAANYQTSKNLYNISSKYMVMSNELARLCDFLLKHYRITIQQMNMNQNNSCTQYKR